MLDVDFTVDIRTVLAVVVLAVVGFYALCFTFLWFAFDPSEGAERARTILPVAAVLGVVGLSVWWLL